MLVITIDNSPALSVLEGLTDNVRESHAIMCSLATELEATTANNFDNESFGSQP